ncbi:hypothetical protein BS47DRAFT_1403156 [Hydnum rufescens UP504]|uniref:Uncharacterized protein n=1 Tax=Hydnum rufescens UP504 TaxID=1448309 RepID=A0A9P6AAK4_9AGAM|nr:hypothetical protein BS47DRAFT_1403156 [Hydnum rufescens UP504]
MHRYIDHIASEDPLTEVPRLGFDDDMFGAVFRYPLPRNLVAIQTILSWLESHGVPIFGVEELRDCVCYDVYGTKQCRDTVLGTSNPTASTSPNKLRHLTNYLDEDAYLNLIQQRSRDALRFRFSGLFGVEALHHPPLQPSNYSNIPPPPTPPTVPEFSHAGPLAMSDDDDEVSTGDELEALWKQMQNDEKGVRRKGVIRQKMDESDEAFEARKVEAEEENSWGEAEVPRRAEENAQMRVEEHSQGDAEAPRHEEGAQILPPENDHHTEGACQSAEENHQPMEEENYQSMDRGNHRPVEEENHRPTEEENHQSIEEENHRPTEEENRRSADKDAPGGEGLTAQNVSEVGNDEKDHNDNSANKAADELAKWLDLTPAPRSPPHHRSFTLPDVISPGLPSEDIFVQGSKSHPPSPSAPYSHQVSHPHHELSPTASYSITFPESLSPDWNSWCFCGTFNSHEHSEHGSHDSNPALATSLLALVTSLLTLMTSIPDFRDNTSCSRDASPRSHGLPSHSHDLPRSHDLPHSHNLPLCSHDLPRNMQSDQPSPSIP